MSLWKMIVDMFCHIRWRLTSSSCYLQANVKISAVSYTCMVSIAIAHGAPCSLCHQSCTTHHKWHNMVTYQLWILLPLWKEDLIEKSHSVKEWLSSSSRDTSAIREVDILNNNIKLSLWMSKKELMQHQGHKTYLLQLVDTWQILRFDRSEK